MSEGKKNYIDKFKDELMNKARNVKTYKQINNDVKKLFNLIGEYQESNPSDTQTVQRWRNWFKTVVKDFPQYNERMRDLTFIDDLQKNIEVCVNEKYSTDFTLKQLQELTHRVNDYRNTYGEDYSVVKVLKWYRDIKPSLPLRKKTGFTYSEKILMNYYLHIYSQAVDKARNEGKDVLMEVQTIIKTISKWLQSKTQEHYDWVLEQMEAIRDGKEPDWFIINNEPFDIEQYDFGKFCSHIIHCLCEMETLNEADRLNGISRHVSHFEAYDLINQILDKIKTHEDTDTFEKVNEDVQNRLKWFCFNNNIAHNVA